MSRANQLVSALAQKTIHALNHGFRDIIAREFPVAPQEDYSHICAIQQKQADQISTIQHHLRTLTQAFLPHHSLPLPSLLKIERSQEEGSNCPKRGTHDRIEHETGSKQVLLNAIRQLVTANKIKTESLQKLMGMIKEQKGYSLEGKQFGRQFQQAQDALFGLLKAKRLGDIGTHLQQRQPSQFLESLDQQNPSLDEEKQCLLAKHPSSHSSENGEKILHNEKREDSCESQQEHLCSTNLPQIIEGFNEVVSQAKPETEILRNEVVSERTDIAQIPNETSPAAMQLLQVQEQTQMQRNIQSSEVEMKTQVRMNQVERQQQTVNSPQLQAVDLINQIEAKREQERNQYQLMLDQLSTQLSQMIQAYGKLQQKQQISKSIIQDKKSAIERLQSEATRMSQVLEQMQKQYVDERKGHEIEEQRWKLERIEWSQQMRMRELAVREAEEKSKEVSNLKSRLVEETQSRQMLEKRLMKVENEYLCAKAQEDQKLSMAYKICHQEKASLQQSFEREKLRIEADLKKKYEVIYHGIDDALKSKIQKYEQQLILSQFNGQVLEGCPNAIKYLVKTVEDLNKSKIKSTKLLFRFDLKNKANFHDYIVNYPHIVIVLQTASNVKLAAYCQERICENPKMGEAVLMSLSTFKTYPLIAGRQAFEYDPYHIIIGRSELRIRVNEKKIYSNFGMGNACFKTEGDSVAQFLQRGSKVREDDLISYEIFTVMFEE